MVKLSGKPATPLNVKSSMLEPSNRSHDRVVVVGHLVEQSPPTPEIRGSNPVIGNFHLVLTVLKRQK